MKKIIIILILLSVSGLVGPKIIGVNANQKLEDFVAEVNETSPYQLEILTSNTGWFKSNATVNVGFDPTTFGSIANEREIREFFEETTANFTLTIQHGPFLTLNGLSLGLLAVKADIDDIKFREYLTYKDEQSLYSIRFDYGFLGGVSVTDTLQGFAIKDFDSMSFSGWNGEGYFSSNGYTYAGEIGSFKIFEGREKLEIKNIAIDLDVDNSIQTALNTVFLNSDYKFTIGSFVLKTSQEQDNVTIRDFALTGNSELTNDGQLMDMGLSYALGELSMFDFDASDILFKFELVNLEKTFFEALQNIGQNITKFEELPTLTNDTFSSSLLTQLKASPELNITEFSGDIDGNRFSSKAHMKLTGIEAMPTFMEDPAFWLSKFVVDAKLEMEKALAINLAQNWLPSKQDAEATIDMLTTMGTINVNAKDNLEVAFILKNRQATLNGNPLPLPF